MGVRFRIRTSQGQEVSFATHEGFQDFVRSGDLAPDDLVYDGETGEWAPARTHPLVLEIEYERAEAARRAATKGAEGETTTREDAAAAKRVDADDSTVRPSDRSGSTRGAPPDLGLSLADPGQATRPGADQDESETWATLDSEDLGLELAPSTGQLTPEEESRRFVERMESERARERDLGEGRVDSTIRMEGAGALADMVRAEVPEPVPEPERARAPARPRRPPPSPARRGRTTSVDPKPRKSGGGGGKLVTGLVLIVVLAAAGYVGWMVFGAPSSTSAASADPDPVDVAQGPDPPSVIPPTVEAVRARARERFLTATQSAVARLDPIPEAWLTGEYFALPSDYPQVPQAWNEYRTTVRSVRSGDTQRYREAYERALDDAGVRGDPDRSTRLDAGVAAFRARLPELQAHWDRVDALAGVALQGHASLVDAEGLILYDASHSTGRPSGIGVGTSGRDADAQLLLDEVIDGVEAALLGDGHGPREVVNVREWVSDGFLDVMSR